MFGATNQPNMYKALLLPLIFLSSLFASAQITGKVASNNNTPLPFVNIYIENTFIGTTSNEHGLYELNLNKTGEYTVVFQYLGYKTLKKQITVTAFPFSLNAEMGEEDISLKEVVINSEDNPANTIIRKAIANRKNILDKINAYKAHFYSRGLIKIKDVPEKFMGQEIGDLNGNLDSTRSGIIYLSETISDIEYKHPLPLKEHITASKISGDDNGFSFNSAGSADFNFYNNTIELGSQIVSPIADYAFSYYRYSLEGVFYDDKGHLINKIKVSPKRKKDRTFEGYVYIIEDDWAFYGLELTVTGEQAQISAANSISIKQSYTYSKKYNLWAKISQTIEFSYGMFGITGEGRFIAVYSDYNFAPEFTKKSFTNEVLSFENEANKKDSLYWESIRPIPLTIEESTDYTKKDSIQTVRQSKTYLDSIDAKNNKFKIGDILFGYSYNNSHKKWNLGYSSLLSDLSFNTVQGFNTSVNAHFRKNIDDFNKFYRINAKLNYGFSDRRLRGNLQYTYKFNNITKPYLILSGGVTVEQFNSSPPISPLINAVSSLFFEDNYMKLYDKSFVEARYSQEIFNGLRGLASLNYQRRKPLFNTTDYTFINENDDTYTSNNPLDPTAYGTAPFSTHNLFKLHLLAQINFGQKYMSYPDGKFNIQNEKYPTLYLGYEKGFAASNTSYNFDQLKIMLKQNLNTGNKGQLSYNLRTGTFFNADDIAFMDYQHFNGNQTHIGTADSYNNVFNNLPYYSLSTNKSYFEAHLEHNFKGYIMNKIPLLNQLNYNLVIGAHALSSESYNPYYEFTVGLNNVGLGKFRFLRLDYVRSYQSGYKNDAIIFGLKFLNIIN